MQDQMNYLFQGSWYRLNIKIDQITGLRSGIRVGLLYRFIKHVTNPPVCMKDPVCITDVSPNRSPGEPQFPTRTECALIKSPLRVRSQKKHLP